VVAALLGLLLRPLPTSAQSSTDGINWSAAASYQFGQTMRFQLSANGAQPIERATLFIRTPDFANAFSAVQALTPPSENITLGYDLDLTQVRLAPFTSVTYWWLLETAVSTTMLPQQTLVYEDDQFAWRQVAQNGVTAHWTGDDPGLGQVALDVAAESLPRLEALIPHAQATPLDVYIYPSAADLRAALRLTGRDWVGAHAHPELGVILVTAVNNRTAAADLRQSIPHELTHLLLYRAVGANYDALPMWFNEGLATTMEAFPNPVYESLLTTAVANQTTISFADLCRAFPDAQADALLAYAQSVSLVNYIEGRYGDQAISRMVAAFADGADCGTGPERVLQRSLTELNRDWLRRQQPRPPLVQFALDNGLWLLLLAGGFGVMGLLLFPNYKG